MFSMPSFHERIDRNDASLPSSQSSPRFASGPEIAKPRTARVTASQSVRSPCNGTCVLSPRDDTCFGCSRTKAEIADWMFASDEERARIVQRCGERKISRQGDQKKTEPLNAGHEE